MFERLFNEPLSVWREADWLFASGWSAAALAAALGIAALALLVSLWRAPLSMGRTVSIGALQFLVAATALTMLWRPALEFERTIPGENSVTWLIDHSESMETTDVAGVSRRQAVVEALLAGGGADETHFDTRWVGLGESTTRLDTDGGLDDLPPPAPRTGIVRALDVELADVGRTSLAAIVLISDGADNIGDIDAAFWQRLASAGVPVHTVGVGQAADSADIELADVQLPASASVDAAVPIRLRIVHPVYPADDTGLPVVRVRISSGDALLSADDVELSRAASETIHTMTIDAGAAGLKRIDVSVAGQAPEANTLNNRQSRVLDVQDAPRRVLYVEGEPRWEYKFLRRALSATAGIDIVSMLRTSPNKFYRQGVRDGSELANGFPQTREALFAYDAVIIGSLPAAELNVAQQAALRDFVNVRGGSLLMLAGRQGLADGGWARSALAVALPVTLDARLGSETFRRERTAVRATQQGLRDVWLRQQGPTGESGIDWSSLPPLADHQSLGEPKPGARVLLETDSGEPLLAMQRYGRGASYVLGTSGTWRWQMALPADDQRHERFWQGLVGELVAETLPRLRIDLASAVVRDSDSTRISVDARDAEYRPLRQAALAATVMSPAGERSTLELTSDPAMPGRFSGSLPLPDDGAWRVSVTSPPEGEAPIVPAVTAERWVWRESGTAESFGARQQQQFLERVSSTSGGRYLSLGDFRELPDILADDNAALTRSEQRPLWNMPAFFLLIAMAKLLEWLLRLRWKRL